MVGKYEVKIYDSRVSYSFEIKRNITIIQGDSGTGKTNLLNMIDDYNQSGISSGVTIVCDKKCSTLRIQEELQASILEHMHGHIIFLDENNKFIRTKAFAEIVNKSDNYFVLICRDSLPQLAYSIDEIYGLRIERDSQKYREPHKVYNEMYKIYNLAFGEIVKPDIVVTEDSNSGYDCFSKIFTKDCRSAGGKGNVKNVISKLKQEEKDILAIVDGAAFGPEMEQFMRKAENCNSKCALYAPESFEYLLLKSGILDVNDDILDKTYDYADSCKYISWEQYYTSYLTEMTHGTKYQYSKMKLNRAYLTDGNLEKIWKQFPRQIEVKSC